MIHLKLPARAALLVPKESRIPTRVNFYVNPQPSYECNPNRKERILFYLCLIFLPACKNGYMCLCEEEDEEKCCQMMKNINRYDRYIIYIIIRCLTSSLVPNFYISLRYIRSIDYRIL